MSSRYNISITNLTGARNRGVEALVYSTIYGLEKELGSNAKIIWSLHTNDPLYDKWRFSEFNTSTYFSYLTNTPNHTRSRAVNKITYSTLGMMEKVLPDRFSVLRSQRQLKQSDLVICSGGDVFTSDYHNLRKHLSFPIVGRRSYLCSHTIGPFTSSDEKYFKKCIDDIDAISVRESLSYDYLKSLVGSSTKIELAADVAFSLPVDKELGKDILHNHLGLPDKTFVVLAISQGIVRYSNLDDAKYLEELKKFANKLIHEGYHIVLVPHVCERNPNNNDMIICRKILNACDHPQRVRIMAYEYSALEYKSVIGHAKALVGARTHATIASMSQLIPTVSIAYSRKAYGIVEDVYGEKSEKVIVNAKEVSCNKLIEAFNQCLKIDIDRDRMAKIKESSKNNFHIARELLEE